MGLKRSSLPTRAHVPGSTHAIDQELRREDAVEAGVDRALARGVARVEACAVAAGAADGEAPGGRHGCVEEQVHRLQRDLSSMNALLVFSWKLFGRVAKIREASKFSGDSCGIDGGSLWSGATRE